MGNRCYLTTETTQIFESNNSLPTFWIMGLAEEHLQLLAQQLERFELAESLSDQEFERRLAEKQFGIITLPFESFLLTLASRSDYISNVYPDLVPLYQDFQELLTEESAYSEKLELIYLDYLSFFNNTDDIFASFSELFKAIDSMEKTNWIDERDILGSTIGSDAFSNHHEEPLSGRYQPAKPENSKKSRHYPTPTKSNLLFQCFRSGAWLLLSLFLTSGSIMMALNSISRIAGIAGGVLFGLGIIIFGGNLKSDLAALRRRKKLEADE